MSGSQILGGIGQFDLTRPAFIEASAGTGKTYTLAKLFTRFLVEQPDVQVDNILVVTYTKAATAELRDRLRLNLHEERDRPGRTPQEQSKLREAILRFDDAAVFTIHGFCTRMLSEFAFDCGLPFDVELVETEDDLIRELVMDFWRRECYGTDAETAAKLELLQAQKLTPAKLAALVKTLVGRPDAKVEPDRAGQTDLPRRLDDLWRELQKPDTLKLLGKNEIKKRAHAAALTLFSTRAARCQGEVGQVKFAAELAGVLGELLGHPSKDLKSSGLHALGSEFRESCSVPGTALALTLKLKLLDRLLGRQGELAAAKRERRLRSYNDMLVQFRDALLANQSLVAKIRAKFKVAMVDEFQDTDPVQWAVFKKLLLEAPEGARRLVLVGDPKQAIYAFRGGDVFTYRQAKREMQQAGADVWNLGYNFRSEPGVIEATNQVFTGPGKLCQDSYTRVDFPPIKDRVQCLVLDGSFPDRDPLVPQAGALQVDMFRTEKRAEGERIVLQAMVKTIIDLLNKGRDGSAVIQPYGRRAGKWERDGAPRPLRPHDITILVNTHAQARAMQPLLIAHGVPAVLQAGGNVFESDEAPALLAVLQAVAQPRNRRAVKAALATHLRGWTPQELHATTLPDAGNAPTAAGGAQTLDEPLRHCQADNATWRAQGFMPMFQAWLERHKVMERLLALDLGERRVTNLLHLAGLLHQTEHERRLGMGGLLQWLADQCASGGADCAEADADRDVAAAAELRLESDEDAVKFLTVHKSKGLEFPVVFCPFIWTQGQWRPEGALVMYHDGTGRLVISLVDDTKGPLGRTIKDERLAEHIRLLYVAMTRAKHRAYVPFCLKTNSHPKTANESSLSYLMDKAPAQPTDGFADFAPDKTRSAPALAQAFAAILQPQPPTPPVVMAQPGQPVPAGGLPQLRPEAETPAPTAGALVALKMPEIDTDWRIESFTGLGHQFCGTRQVPAAATPAEQATAELKFQLPRGPAFGKVVHAIFENVPFAADRGTITQEAQRQLELVRLLRAEAPADRRVPLSAGVTAMVADALATPLPASAGGAFALKEVAADRCRHELEFHFPLRDQQLSGVAAVFAGMGGIYAAAAGRLAGARDRRLKGLMTGFIDLVFEHAGRYYIVDWKTNWITGVAADFGVPADPPQRLACALADELVAHNYPLQWALYTVALHRHLRAFKAGYDYGRAFGGVFYLFVRATDPKVVGQGVWAERLDPSQLAALDQVLGRGVPA